MMDIYLARPPAQVKVTETRGIWGLSQSEEPGICDD